MAGFKIESFTGIVPRKDHTKLMPGEATIAANCKLWSGVLSGWNGPRNIVQVTKSPPFKTIYRYAKTAGDDLSGVWFNWPEQVDVARGVVRGDNKRRLYFTGLDYPRITDALIGIFSSGDQYPQNSYRLGVPQPPNTMTLTVNGSPSAEATDADIRTTTYIVTFVTQWTTIEEEGAPSGPAVSVEVSPGQTVSIFNIPTAPTGNYNVAVKRLYRLAQGGNGTRYYFVKELPIYTTSWEDTYTDAQLGEELSVAGNYPPPEDLHSIVSLPNGILIGATNDTICPSEQYQPHAFNPLNQMPVNYPVVGIGSFGNTAVALTEEGPFFVTGTSPSTMSATELPTKQGCISKRSIVSTPYGVLYASPDGLALVETSGAVNIVTEPFFTRDGWQFLNPRSIHAAMHDERYIAFFTLLNGTKGGFVLDPRAGRLTMLDFYYDALYSDPVADALYAVDGDQILQWDFDATNRQPYQWRSGAFLFPRPITIQSGQVFAQDYEDIYITIYAGTPDDLRVIHRQEVVGRAPFRIPGGSTYICYQIEIEGVSTVSQVCFAETISELSLL